MRPWLIITALLHKVVYTEGVSSREAKAYKLTKKYGIRHDTSQKKLRDTLLGTLIWKEKLPAT